MFGFISNSYLLIKILVKTYKNSQNHSDLHFLISNKNDEGDYVQSWFYSKRARSCSSFVSLKWSRKSRRLYITRFQLQMINVSHCLIHKKHILVCSFERRYYLIKDRSHLDFHFNSPRTQSPHAGSFILGKQFEDEQWGFLWTHLVF